MLIRLIALIGLVLAGSVALSEEVTVKGADAFAVMRKMTCGTLDVGVPRYGIFEGRVYSRVPGEKDRHLFNLLGINTRQCASVRDPKRGDGFRSVSREIMMYLDKETGEPADEWANPFTGQTVEVVHVANDPVNMRAPRYEKDADGKRGSVTVRRYGPLTASSGEVPLFYLNPLGGEFQDYVGGRYHAMEIFNTFYPTDELLDSELRSLSQSNISWVRVAQWLPWMTMGDKPGIMIFNATGFSTFEQSLIPGNLMEILESRYPEYLTPPPLADDRVNETSWTVFRDHVGEKRASDDAEHD
ncbi:MAG: DUF1838 family protein [Gammaproteobacteria bacterium]